MIVVPSDLLATSSLVSRMLRSIGFRTSTANSLSGVVIELLQVAVVLVVAGLASHFGGKATIRIVTKFRHRESGSNLSERALKRLQTLGHTAASTIRFAIWALALITILGTLKINLAPLLAGATFIGAALGIGAQSIVKDVISGFFLIAEDQFGIGDSICTSDVSGIVEDITLRVTRLRALDGTVWYVSNGDIRKLGNQSVEWNRSVVDIQVNQGQDIQSVLSAARSAVQVLYQSPEASTILVSTPEVWGVDAMDADHATIRIVSKTAPGRSADVGRMVREAVGTAFTGIGALTGPQPQPGLPRPQPGLPGSG